MVDWKKIGEERHRGVEGEGEGSIDSRGGSRG